LRRKIKEIYEGDKEEMAEMDKTLALLITEQLKLHKDQLEKLHTEKGF
jgi:hypothetical protein